MPRAGRFLSLLLAVSAVGAGVDLTTFRTSYAHYALASWHADLRAMSDGHRDSLLRRVKNDLSFSGGAGWQARTRSDNLDWLVRLPLLAGAGASGQTTSHAESTTTRDESGIELSSGPELEALGYLPGTDLFLQMRHVGYFWTGSGSSPGRTGQGYHASLDSRVAFGWGRVRDAWPLRKAVHVSELLYEEGVLQRKLSDDELQELAAFLSRSWRLFLAHQRAARFYYDSLSALLERSGATRGSLPARAIMRLEEKLYVGSFERPFGWRAGVGASAFWVREYSQGTYRDSAWQSAKRTTFYSPTALVEYARPVGLNWTFDASLDYEAHTNWEKMESVLHSLVFSGSASWQALDRLEFTLTPFVETRFTHQLTACLPSELRIGQWVDLACSYYLADRLRASAGLHWHGYARRFYGVMPEPPSTLSSLGLSFKLHWGPLPRGWGVRYYL